MGKREVINKIWKELRAARTLRRLGIIFILEMNFTITPEKSSGLDKVTQPGS